LAISCCHAPSHCTTNGRREHPLKIAVIMKGKRFLGADHDLQFMIGAEG